MNNNRSIRLLLTGGETGGHLYPALAVADTLAEALPGSETVYVGAAGRVDMTKAIGTKYATHSLAITPYQRSGLLGNIALPWRLLCSFVHASSLLGRYRPHAVMGVGAFPSVPVILAARYRRIPTLLLEPNAQPGLANGLLAKMVQRICVSRPGMEKYFHREKLVITGTPVRGGLQQKAADRQQARAALGIPGDVRTVLITGGSTGSVTINNLVLENIERLSCAIGHLLWQTGERDDRRIRNTLANRLPKNCTILPYIDDMGFAYGAADLVISSAGAVSLAELALLGKAAFIIPDPDVTENHQRQNAIGLSEQEACVLIDGNIAPQQTTTAIIDLLNDVDKLEQLRKNIRRHAEPQAARRIVELILQLVESTSQR